MKIVLSILGGIIVLAVVAFFVVAFSLGSIVKTGVNRMGPQLTQAPVHLESARISPFSGQGTLSQLVIGNPQGWSSDHALALGKLTIDVEPRSLASDHVIVNQLVIDQPDIVYESRITSSNLQDLVKNIQQSTGADQQAQTKEGKPIKIEIRHFQMQNGKITVKVSDRSVSLDMPTLTLDNLGTSEGGLTPQQLALAVMKEITAQAIQAGARAAVSKGLLDKAGAKVEDSLRKLLGGSKDGGQTPQPATSP